MDTQTILMLAPIVVLELVMKAIALVNLSRQPRTRGPKPMWVLIILLVSVIGWILYFAIGREDQ